MSLTAEQIEKVLAAHEQGKLVAAKGRLYGLCLCGEKFQVGDHCKHRAHVAQAIYSLIEEKANGK